MTNVSGISCHQEILGKSTVPIQCRFLRDFWAGRGFVDQNVNKVPVGIWENNMPCGAHNFLGLSCRLLKSIVRWKNLNTFISWDLFFGL